MHSWHMADEQIMYSVRMPRALKDRFKADAAKEQRSLNAHFVHILQQYVDGELVPAAELLKNRRVRALIKTCIREALSEK